MKLKKMAATAAIIFTFATSVSFAAPIHESPDAGINGLHQHDAHRDKHSEEFRKDPVKALEQRKIEIQNLVKDGKMTKEKADGVIKGIDARIAEIKEFNKLTPDQKKEKVTKDFKQRLENDVKKGKISQDEADSRMREFAQKIKEWDGTGYPMFHHKRK